MLQGVHGAVTGLAPWSVVGYFLFKFCYDIRDISDIRIHPAYTHNK